MSDLVDRIEGARSSLAFKAPCRVATTANITLSGEQTIDGVAVLEVGANNRPDRVLVKDQTDATQNGIYTVSTGVWSRAKDFDGNTDIVTGTRVFVHAGTAGSGEYIVTSADPIIIDTSSITITSAPGNVAGATTDNAVARYSGTSGGLQNSGVTIDDSNDVAGVANFSISGSITVGGTVDGRDVAADGTKLDGIESGATADQSAAEILTALLTVDGPSSGLNADLLDGNEASAFYASGGTDVPVADGGTGRSSHTAYAVLCGGTTTTAAQQSIADVGTSGQVLTSNGAGALPTFQSSSAAIVNAVESGTLSSQATLDISLGSADMYEIDLIAIAPATDTVHLYARFSQSSTFLAGASDYRWSQQTEGIQSSDLADSEIDLGVSGDLGNSTNEHSTLTIRIYRPSAASFHKSLIFYGYNVKDSADIVNISGAGSLIANSDAIDGVRFLFSSGDIASGYYAVRSYSFT